MGMTMVEKMFSKKNVTGLPVRAGDFVDARLDGIMVSHGNIVRMDRHVKRSGVFPHLPRVWDVDKVYAMSEHYQPPPTALDAEVNKLQRRAAERLGLKHFYDAESGICHQMMCDYGHARPGELILGTDSHSVLYGALNAFGTGMAETDTSYGIVFGDLWFQVPPTIKITLKGRLPDCPFAKDVMIYLASQFGDDFAQYKCIEFTGPAAREMDIESRMCMSDHVVEVGGKFGMFDADEKTTAYLSGRTGVPYEPITADPDAVYEREITVDVGKIGFQVAKPHRYQNGVPVESVAGTHIDQAVIGACSNGRFQDIDIAARILSGKRIASNVRFLISPASWTVYRQCLDAGLIPTLLDAGCTIVTPGCGVCGGRQSYLADDEVCITATTRNYEGRMGSVKSTLYLAGPATVAASAIAGKIIDPSEALNAL